MTEQVDLDALIAEAQSFVEGTSSEFYENHLVRSLAAGLRQERERASDMEGAYNSAVERHRLAAEKRDEYQQLYGDMADDERRARVALKRAEETIEKVRIRHQWVTGVSPSYCICGTTFCETATLLTEYDKLGLGTSARGMV